MDGIKLNLTGLKDKVASKLQSETQKSQRNNKRDQGKRNDSRVQGRPSGRSTDQENGKHNKPANGHQNQEFTKSESKKPDLKKDLIEGKADEEDLDAIIRREALELGATEEDLKLLEGIDDGDESEQEFNDDGKLEKSLGDDLSKFMKEIGLGKGAPVVIEDDEEDEPEEEEEDDNNEAEDESPEEAYAQEEVEEFEMEKEKGQRELDIKEEEEEEQEEDDEEEEEANEVFQDVKKSKSEDLPTHKKVDPTRILDSSRLLISPQIDWYNVPFDSTPAAEALSKEQIEKLYQRGKDALEADNKAYYDEFSKTSSQRKFLSQILSGGTLNDKISALTLLIQEAPAHNLKSLDTLLGFTNKKSRNSILQSLNALKDLFINGLLPDRKLRNFKNQPLSLMTSKKQLAIYYFEDYLKVYYFKIIQILEKLSHDPIIHVRQSVVGHIFDLLKSKPEQEVNLLRLGVNKIGDIDKKVTSKTSYQILQLEQAHPNMKKIVIDAVIDAMFKQNTDYHTQYYSVLTLNQTILTRREDDVANELVKTYFALFEKLLIESDPHNVDKVKKTDPKQNKYADRKKNFKKGKKGGKSVKNTKTDEEVIEEKNSKLFSALLTGVNRAFPFATLLTEIYTKHLDTLFRITHSSNFNTSVQALVLIFQIVSTQKLNNDRFYRTLYESLLDSRLITSSKQGIYLNLLFKALKQDSNIPRVLAFVKRIVQICYNWTNVGPVAGMFYLLMELEKSVPQIRNLAINTPVDYKYIDDEDDEEEHFQDVKSDDEDQFQAKIKPTKDIQYDGRKRDPKFANASNSSIWEINEFLNHYHPTIQLYAESFLNQSKQHKPDLGLFTLSHFLDRFVYRNAKQKATTKGSSIMQPLGGTHTGSLLVKASNKDTRLLAANTENWLEKRVEEIRPDERFFYEYFTSKEADPSRVNEPKEEDFEQDSDLDDEEVWDALVKSQPEIDGDLGSDLDDMSDLDQEDFSDFDDEDIDMDDKDSDEEGGDKQGVAAFIDDEAEDSNEDEGSEIELQTIGMSDDSDYEEEEPVDESQAEEDPDFKGFSESEDEEAELFKGDSEDELSSEEEAEEEEAPRSKKRSAEENRETNTKKSKKAKLKELPIFADADAYSHYLGSDEDD